MNKIKYVFIEILFLILNSTFIFALPSGYVSSIESKNKKEPELLRITITEDNIKEYEVLYENDIINENDILQTDFHTKATIKIDGLEILINPQSRIVVKYAIQKEKDFKALYELKKGYIDVSFDSSKYDTKEVIVEIPSNRSKVVITGTKLRIYSSGQVKVHEGRVEVRSTSSRRSLPPKMLGPGDFGSLQGGIINQNNPVMRRPEGPRRPGGPSKPSKPMSNPARNQPVQVPGGNKAPHPSDRNNK